MSGSPRTFRFGPLERRGLAGSLRLSQVVTVALALLGAVLVLDIAPGATAALAGLVLVLLAAGGALLPVHGATAVEWAPVVAAFLRRNLGTRKRRITPAPTRGLRRALSSSSASTPELWLPPSVGQARLIDLPYRSRSLGAISENRRHRLTALLACEVSAFQLLDPPGQERRLAQWGNVLAASAGTSVRRLQWLERTAPAQGDELAGWLHSAGDPQFARRGEPLLESYLELIDSAAPVIHDHEILLAIQIDTARVRGGDEAAARALIEETERAARGLEAAEVRVLGGLSARQVAGVLRTAFDPYARAELAAHRAVTGEDGSSPELAGPVAVAERWDSLRVDGALHATFWIAGWPRVDVPAAFMGALLSPSGTVRTVAVCFEPIPAARSTRDIEAAITRDRADREIRRRFGQSETARQRMAEEAALRREAELASGHGEVRFSGFVTVSGRDEDELRHSCQQLLQQAAVARLELRRLYGNQAEAFTFTLPLARGLT